MTNEQEWWVSGITFTTRGGAIVSRETIEDNKPVAGCPGTRSEIEEFSEASRKRLAFFASNSAEKFRSMVTLTYARDYPTDGLVVRSDREYLLNVVRRYLPGVKYLWFLEWQRRGAPHIHILLTCRYNVLVQPKLSMAWANRVIRGADYDEEYQEWVRWFNGSTRKVKNASGCQFWQNGKTDGGLSRYAVKYAVKMHQKDVPPQYRNVGRFWGCTRGLVEFLPTIHYSRGDYIPSADKLFPGKPLTGLPKYVFGDG